MAKSIMINAALLAALAFSQEGRAAPTMTEPRPCIELDIPVSIDMTATKWLQLKVDSNVDVVDWVTDLTTWTSPNITERMIGEVRINDTFKIHGQLCVPSEGAKSDILQIATHGAGFDKRYWDAEIKPHEYSYVSAALAKGYSIFTYDRLGTGASDKPDAYDVVQVSVQVEILRQLTVLARAGDLVRAASHTAAATPSSGNDGDHDRFRRYRPAKIVHVGHSLGSAITLGLIGSSGSINNSSSSSSSSNSDGVVATGFLHTTPGTLAGANVATWGLELAREQEDDDGPGRQRRRRRPFSDRGPGYVVQATRSNVQLSFLKKGSFEPALLEYAWRIRQPVSVSEYVSFGTMLGRAVPDFRGPLQFFVGEKDYDICEGNCIGAYDVDEIKKRYYPRATALEVHLQPGTGHALTLSKNATAGYEVIFGFLERAGL